MVVERQLRKLKAPELMRAVFNGGKYEGGQAMQTADGVAA